MCVACCIIIDCGPTGLNGLQCWSGMFRTGEVDGPCCLCLALLDSCLLAIRLTCFRHQLWFSNVLIQISALCCVCVCAISPAMPCAR
jgi:hypothetical protein